MPWDVLRSSDYVFSTESWCVKAASTQSLHPTNCYLSPLLLTFVFCIRLWICVCVRVWGASVVPGGETPLSQHTYHSGGHQVGSSWWQGHHWEAARQEALPNHLPTRPGHGKRDWWDCGCCVSNYNHLTLFHLGINGASVAITQTKAECQLSF